jgi:hypothetical protein
MPVRTSSLRTLRNIFAIECFIDELASAAGQDPIDFPGQSASARNCRAEVLGFGGGSGDTTAPDDNGRRTRERSQNPDSPVQVVGAGYLDQDAISQLTEQERKRLVQ